MRPRRRQALPPGFTIVELVVVLAIVVVLAAITFAATGPAREKGRQQVCVSNLHQLTAALIQYRADWDGSDVGETRPECGFPPTGYEVLSLRPYVRGDKAWQCPDVSAAQLKATNRPGKDGFWSLYSPGWIFGPDFAPGMPTVGSVLRRRGDMFVSWVDTYHDFAPPDQPHVSGLMVVARLNGSVSVRMKNLSLPAWEW